jgi:outer membrane protein assembly factor BamB
VFDQDRIYLAGGGDIWWGKNEAWLKCIAADRAREGAGNDPVWSYPLSRHVLGTPAVSDGLVFIADVGRTFHCVNARTGEGLWTHDVQGEVWASPFVADGKVYLGTRGGWFYIFAAAKEKQVLQELNLASPISATATAANGVLYIANMKRLFALKTAKP